jgi:hypothetical protein
METLNTTKYDGKGPAFELKATSHKLTQIIFSKEKVTSESFSLSKMQESCASQRLFDGPW